MKTKMFFSPNFATELGTHCALHQNYSPQEQKYLFRLDVFDQQEIGIAISQKAHHGQLDLNQFSHLGNVCRLEVPYKALEPCKQHYQHLEKALVNIGSKKVGIPYTIASQNGDGSNTLCYKEFDYLFKFVRSINKGQLKYAVLEMPIPVAQYYFSLDLGYFKVSPKLYESFHAQSARCLYLLAESRLKKGYDKFKPEEVFSLLTSHAQYRGTGNLECQQLDVAEAEIKNAYKLNMIDYTIIHHIETTRNQVMGAYGKLVIFSVKYRQEDTSNMSPKERIELSQARFKLNYTLTSYWKVSKSVANNLADRMSLEDMDAVRQCFLAACEELRKNHVKNPAGYIVTSLNKILKQEANNS